jgi:hypothetical protein
MAHYALLDDNNIVIQVITGKDENELDNEGNQVDWEAHYSEFTGKTCKRTSYNTRENAHLLGGVAFRGNYAGIGYTYDEEFNVFIPPKRFNSWKMDYEKFVWVAPVSKPAPEEGFIYNWSEPNLEWIKLAIPST